MDVAKALELVTTTSSGFCVDKKYAAEKVLDKPPLTEREKLFAEVLFRLTTPDNASESIVFWKLVRRISDLVNSGSDGAWHVTTVTTGVDTIGLLDYDDKVHVVIDGEPHVLDRDRVILHRPVDTRQ